MITLLNNHTKVMMNLIEQQFEINKERFRVLSKEERKILALMALRRQFNFYKKCAQDTIWNRSNEYQYIFEKCYEQLSNKVDIDETVWMICDKNKPESILMNQPKLFNDRVSYANIFITNFEEFIDNWLDDIDGEECFLQFNFDYIEVFFNTYFEGTYTDIYNLIDKEIKLQNHEYILIKSKQYQLIKEKCLYNEENILGQYWFNENFVL